MCFGNKIRIVVKCVLVVKCMYVIKISVSRENIFCPQNDRPRFIPTGRSRKELLCPDLHFLKKVLFFLKLSFTGHFHTHPAHDFSRTPVSTHPAITSHSNAEFNVYSY